MIADQRMRSNTSFVLYPLVPEARRKYQLSHAQVQMARELGLNLKKLGGMANHHQQPWKAPFPEYIEHLFQKQFGRPVPEDIRSIEVKETALTQLSVWAMIDRGHDFLNSRYPH